MKYSPTDLMRKIRGVSEAEALRLVESVHKSGQILGLTQCAKWKGAACLLPSGQTLKAAVAGVKESEIAFIEI